MGAGRAGRNGFARGAPEDVGCAGTSSADVNGLLVADAEPATGEIDMLLSMLRPEMPCTACIELTRCFIADLRMRRKSKPAGHSALYEPCQKRRITPIY